jgi:hypothetical protein
MRRIVGGNRSNPKPQRQPGAPHPAALPQRGGTRGPARAAKPGLPDQPSAIHNPRMPLRQVPPMSQDFPRALLTEQPPHALPETRGLFAAGGLPAPFAALHFFLLSPSQRRGHLAGRPVHQDALGTRNRQVQGFGFADELSGAGAAFRQIRRALRHIMRVGGQDVDDALLQHALGPVARPAAETPRERARCNLDPHAARGQHLNHAVLGLDPRKPLRMRKNGDVSRQEDTEKQILQPRRGAVMRRFRQRVGRISQCQKMPLLEARDKFRDDVIIRPRCQPERDCRVVEPALERGNRPADLRPVIMIEARKNVRGTGDSLNPLIHQGPRHIERHPVIQGTVVDSRQQMAMKVEHKYLTNGTAMPLVSRRPCFVQKRGTSALAYYTVRIAPQLIRERRDDSLSGCMIRSHQVNMFIPIVTSRQEGGMSRMSLILAVIVPAMVPSAHAAHLSDVEGAVFVNNQPVSANAEVAQGDRIRATKGSATLVYADGSTLRIRRGTTLVVHERRHSLKDPAEETSLPPSDVDAEAALVVAGSVGLSVGLSQLTRPVSP